MSDELAFASATELARLVRTRAVSPVELTELYLDRIARLDGRINAFVTVDAAGARAGAKAAEERVTDGTALPPFLGVPIAVKDLHLTEGLPTTFGCRSLAHFVPTFDEECVARIKRAGFVVLGKTNVPEFGTVPYTESLLHGPCRNPWDVSRTAGGSSGGAAASVAAGLTPLAHGSDGGGSIRIPASNCGLFGLKPARGRISAAPLFGDRLAGLSTAGPITRHTADAAGLLDVMEGYATGDPSWAPPPARPFAREVEVEPGPLRLGVVTEWPFGTFEREPLAALEGATRLLDSLGHHLEPVTLPLSEGFRDDFEVVWAAGLAALPVDPARLEPFNRLLFDLGTTCSAARLLQAVNGLQVTARAVIGATAHLDGVLSPTLAAEPLSIGAFAERPVDELFDANAAYVGLAPLANVTGEPSMNLPLHRSPAGLPVGVMVTGRPADEVTLLRLAAQVERAVDWTADRPAVRQSADTSYEPSVRTVRVTESTAEHPNVEENT
ncbi:amidase [soil metagenome]